MLEEIIIFITVNLLLLIASAFVTAWETALTALTPIEWKIAVQKQKKITLGYKIVNLFQKKYSTTVAACLIINNLLATSAGIFSLTLLSSLIDEQLASIISLILVTFLLVLFGEFIPKNIVKKNKVKFLVKTSYLSFLLWILFFPLSWIFGLLFKKNEKILLSKDDFDHLTGIALENKVFDSYEAELVYSALELDDKKIANYMSNNPVYVYKNKEVKDLLKLYSKYQYTRIVVVEENEKDEDNPIVYGVLNFKLLLEILFNSDDGKFNDLDNINIDQAIQEPLFLSGQLKLDEALRKMQKSKNHLAIVTPSDDDQTMIGVITLEDILEELVGEIYDENDDEMDFQIVNDVSWLVFENFSAIKMLKKLDFLKYNFSVTRSTTVKKFFLKYFKVADLEFNKVYKNDLINLTIEKDLETEKVMLNIHLIDDYEEEKNLDFNTKKFTWKAIKEKLKFKSIKKSK